MFFDLISSSLQSLYIHIPFCSCKCSYCDFFSLTGQGPDIVDSVVKETIEQAGYFRQKYNISDLKTLYIGGGTPTYLSPSMLEYLIKSILRDYPAEPEELTVEVNPENLTSEYIDLFADLPVNRISLGIQTFSRKFLSLIGRNCSLEKNLKAIEMLKKLDRIKLNIDLISSLPGQNVKEALQDAETAVKFNPDHISLYSLTLEKGTILSEIYTEKNLDEKCWIEASDYLYSSRYSHYEISNFSCNNAQSQHNMNYWRMKPYAGCGMTAVSTVIEDNKAYRITAPDNVLSFLTGRNNNWGCLTEEILPGDYFIDTIMMGSRTAEGISISRLNKIFDIDTEKLLSASIKKWQNKNMLQIKNGFLSLTREGRLFHTSFMIDIISDIDNQKLYFT